jgi:hypothetical protein
MMRSLRSRCDPRDRSSQPSGTRISTSSSRHARCSAAAPRREHGEESSHRAGARAGDRGRRIDEPRTRAGERQELLRRGRARLQRALRSQSVAGGGAYINFAGRLGFDINAWHDRDVAFLVNPSLQIGGGFATIGQTFGYFYLNPSVELSLSLVDGLIGVYWRPLGFEIGIGGGAVGTYTMMFGVTFNF